jgi:hypothetical protein
MAVSYFNNNSKNKKMAKATADTISDTEVLQAPQPVKEPIKVAPLTEVENRIFILSNDKRRGTVSLDVEEDVIDPETGKVRRMRLLRGAQTIWFDEQPPTVFPQNYVNKNILNLEFNKGVCIIPVNEPQKIKAAELTNRNLATKKRNGLKAKTKDIYFYEWNPAEQNKKAIEEENDVIKAMQLAMTTPMEEVIPHAQYLNIQFADEQGVALNEQALRAAYIRKAKNDSRKFLDSIQSPTVKLAHMVRKAIDKGLIDLGKQAGAAYWTDGGFISALPQGRDAVEFLIEFAMIPGEANVMFANQLRELT